MNGPSTIVVAVGRQIGSGGGELAHRLAKRLGFTCIDQQIAREAAKYLGADEHEVRLRQERVSHFWQRVGRVLAHGAPDSVYTDFRVLPEVPDQAVFEAGVRAIRELTAHCDSVVVGHAGFHVLRDLPGLIKVFVSAPMSFRVDRVRRIYNIANPDEARATVERSDREREVFMRRMAGLTWMDPRNYDVCFDMGRFPMDLAVETIERLVAHRRQELGLTEPRPCQ